METTVPAGIDLKFLQSSCKKFIKNYEYALIEFVSYIDSQEYMNYIKKNGWDADKWQSIPEAHSELKFIKTLMCFLKERHEELFQIDLVSFKEHYKRKELSEDIEDEKYIALITSSLGRERKNEKLRKETKEEFQQIRRKNSFLMSRALKLGYQVSLEEEILFVRLKEEEEEPLNMIGTKASEKIVYLNELGIIDHLRSQEPFKHNINKLATVLSAITDENATTLQPALNAMLNVTNSPEKNPYHSKKTATKIKNLLIELGLDLEKN